VLRIGSLISDPRIGYRLDPGEPGVLRGASASTSTLRVVEQEQRNLNRFRSRAVQEGKTVVFANIKYLRQFRGSFMATVAGETRVVLEDRPASEPIVPGEAPAVVAEYFDSQGKPAVAPELAITTAQGAAPRLDALQTERAALERSRSETEQRLKSAKSLVRPYLEHELARLEGRMSFLDKEIERLAGPTVMSGTNPGSLVARGLGDLLA
jgi:hypothetical protein